MFIQTEDTPNPATMKFSPGRLVAHNPVDIDSAEKAADSPLAQALFAIKGVAGVFLGTDFISVTRAPSAPDWQVLRPALLSAMMDYFSSPHAAAMDGAGDAPASSPPPAASEDDAEIVAQIMELLDHRIRPAVMQDGGDVAFERYEDGIVYLRLKGACAGCPSATATLKFGIEQMLRHFIPEVQEVRRVM